MTKIIFAIALLVVEIAHAQNQTDSFAQMVGDKSTWQAMNWNRFETSKIWTASGWNEEESKDSNRTFVKSRTVRLFDIDFKANLNRRNDAVKTPWTLAAITMKSSTADCENAKSWATTRFGSPTVSIDGSHEGTYSDDLSITVTRVQLTSQWDIGDTRIVLGCDGVDFPIRSPDADGRTLFLVISFEHKSATEVKPMFMLSCSRKIASAGQQPEDAQSLTFYVDEYWKTVRSPQKKPFAGDSNRKEFSITPDTITFAIRYNKDILVKYSVNRLTGTLYGTTTGGPPLRISGMCEKVEPSSKRF